MRALGDEMIEKISIMLDLIIIITIFFCLPGALLIINGVKTINNKKAVTIGRDSHFRWQRPIILTGGEAVKIGKINIVFGVIFFVMGTCLISMLLLFT
jgi:hypothetical protein